MKYYCDYNLLKLAPKILFYYYVNKKEQRKSNYFKIKTKSRSSTILPFFEKCCFYVYNGKKYIQLPITRKHFFYKLGEFSFTKVICKHNKKKKRS